MSLDIIIVVIVFVIIFSISWYFIHGKNSSKKKRSQSLDKKIKQLSSAKLQGMTGSIQEQEYLIPKESDVVKIPDEFLNFKLLRFDDLNDKQQQEIDEMSHCTRQPNPLLLTLTQSEIEPKELMDLIKSDAEMTAKIINTVNSSLFALRQPIESIQHAIVFMGVAAVKSIAIQFILQQSISFQDKAQAAAYKKIWISSYLASSFVFLLAKHLDKENAAELSTLCLLVCLGDMTMFSYKPSMANLYLNHTSLYERVRDEQLSLGTNAAVIGKVLAERWQLPKSIVEGIGNSLNPLVNNTLNRDQPIEEFQNTLLCYFSCRLGDLVAFEGVRDIFQVGDDGVETLNGLDFYYVQTSVEQAGLEKISQLFRDQSFISKAKKLIAQIAV
ncbi:MAG: HDOD domain-containing protein [Colwellia sp.]|nr:HDOD domain-containing protein [Colwellia sp.]